MADERCGVVLRVAGYDTHCMRPYEHDGPCFPLRQELMNEIERLDAASDELSMWVIDADDKGAPWPPRLAANHSRPTWEEEA